MFDFRDLVAAIRMGCDFGVRSVAEKNRELIERYFDKISDDLHAEDEGAGGDDAHRSNVPGYRPKMVALSFPKETSQGTGEHHVYVPLISLIPLSELSISELEIQMKLVVAEDDGNLKVGFVQSPASSGKKGGLFRRDAPESEDPHFNAKVKITFSETGSPDGLTSIIEGYNKALRAQVPG